MGQRIAVCTLAYNEERFIGRCIKQFRGLKHLVLVSLNPWGNYLGEPDNTAPIAKSLGAEVVEGVWENEASQRNEGQRRLANYDWVLIVDADEEYTPQDIKKLFKFLATADKPAYGADTIEVYWKSRKYRIRPRPSGGLIVAVKPSVVFTQNRCIEGEWGFLPKDIVMHHDSYVRTDKEMLSKIKNFEHRDELVDGWYEKVWKRWAPEMENLHPVNPPDFKRAVKW